MRTPEQVKWDFVQQWLDKARKDLATGEILLREEFEDYENAGFHAQETRALIMESLRPYLDAGRPGGGELGKS
jgi:hypothetical protein